MDFKQIIRTDIEHSFNLFNRFPVIFESGLGCELVDVKGKKYVDFFGGMGANCLGYNDTEMSAALTVQISKLVQTSNAYYNIPYAELLGLLTDQTYERAYICNSGTEAVEAALKLTSKYIAVSNPARTNIVALKNSYHGRTFGALSVTGQDKYRKDFEPLNKNVVFVEPNDAKALKNALSDSSTGALIIETIQGESGVFPLDSSFIQLAEKLCRENSVVFIVDEVHTGIGRTGIMYSFQHFGVTPDIVTVSKALGGGVPIGAMLANKTLGDVFEVGDHSSTFGGNALCCSAACVVLKRLKNTDLLKNIVAAGNLLGNKLSALSKLKSVKQVRGLGLLWGVELMPFANARNVAKIMLEEGFVVGTAGNNTLRFCPPYIISADQIESMTKTLSDTLKKQNY